MNARQIASEAIKKYEWGSKEVGIRINGLDTSLWLDDLRAAAQSRPSFILVPKIEEPSEVRLVDKLIRSLLQNMEHALPHLIVAIENSKGVINIEDILKSSDLITAIEFGAEDYSLSLGILSIERSEMSSLYARSRIVGSSKAFGIDPLDQAYVNLTDLEGLRKSAIDAKNLGFTGKSVIHPNQIDVVNEVFTPTSTEISWAKGIIQAWKVAQEEGRGAFRFENKMVDVVHVRMAENILDIDKRVSAGSRSNE